MSLNKDEHINQFPTDKQITEDIGKELAHFVLNRYGVIIDGFFIVIRKGKEVQVESGAPVRVETFVKEVINAAEEFRLQIDEDSKTGKLTKENLG